MLAASPTPNAALDAVKKNLASSLISLVNFRQFDTRMEAAVPRVSFTANLQRQLSAPPCEPAGGTVRAALESVFAADPLARSYVLDDQGRVRHHVVVFIGGERIRDPVGLSDPVSESDEIFVMQSLAGG